MLSDLKGEKLKEDSQIHFCNEKGPVKLKEQVKMLFCFYMLTSELFQFRFLTFLDSSAIHLSKNFENFLLTRSKY